MSEYRVKVFQYLHKPYQVLFLEEDELVLFTVLFFLAFVFGGIFWILIIPCVFGYASIKKRLPRGHLRHYLYKLGVVNLKGYPSYFEDRFNE